MGDDGDRRCPSVWLTGWPLQIVDSHWSLELLQKLPRRAIPNQSFFFGCPILFSEERPEPSRPDSSLLRAAARYAASPAAPHRRSVISASGRRSLRPTSPISSRRTCLPSPADELRPGSIPSTNSSPRTELLPDDELVRIEDPFPFLPMDGDDNARDEEIERIRHLLGVAHDLAVLGYYGNLYCEKYLNKSARRISQQIGLEWVHEQLDDRKRCYKMFRMYPDVFELDNLNDGR
nr:uncharacterized protein LOC127310380 [Lolium perenne]